MLLSVLLHIIFMRIKLKSSLINFVKKLLSDFFLQSSIIFLGKEKTAASLSSSPTVINTSKKITLTYLGGNRYTLSLDPVTREAVKATRELANLMKNVDDLKREYQLNVRTLELADKQVLQLEKQQSEQNAE